MKTERIFIPTPSPVQSLCWHQDALFDWVSGGVAYGLDGGSINPHVRYSYRFDRAVMSPDGRYSILYEVLGTKGLVLKEGKVLREIHRSFYHADTYEYPIALHTLPSGRTLLAHCPDEYCRIEIEDLETGERLTRRTSESPDIFHSRLQFSSDGRYLLSGAWIWHPIDMVFVFDVTHVLEQPESLDAAENLQTGDDWGCELHSATFGAKDTVVLFSSDPAPNAPPRPKDENTGGLAVYSLTERCLLSVVSPEDAVGTLMVVGDHVVSFFQHPTLIELTTGRTVERWPKIDSGTQGSSIIRHLPPQPPLALDPAGRRFAVGTEKGIEVVRFAP